MSLSGRDAFWDAVRAVLMWLVVLGHTIQQLMSEDFFGHPLFKAIYLFHIPLFFFISGYFAFSSIKKHGVGGLKKTAVRLLAPILTFGSLHALFLVCKGVHLTLPSFLRCYVCLWFLWCLFECQLCANFLIHVQKLAGRISILLLPFILCILAPQYIPYADYLGLAWPCFVAGLLARKAGFSSHHITTRWYWVAPVAFLCFFIFQDNWYVYTYPLSLSFNAIGVSLFRLLAAAAAGCIFLALMHQGAAMLRLAKIGTATLGIYIVQCVVFKITAHISLPACFSQAWLMVLISLPIFFASYYAYLITRKIPLVGIVMYGDAPQHQIIRK